MNHQILVKFFHPNFQSQQPRCKTYPRLEGHGREFNMLLRIHMKTFTAFRAKFRVSLAMGMYRV